MANPSPSGPGVERLREQLVRIWIADSDNEVLSERSAGTEGGNGTMRRLLAVMLMLCVAHVAMAANLGVTSNKVETWIDNGDHAYDGREGGETCATAVPVGALPYTDTGATCDNINDYDWICPYSMSTAQDVVYSFNPPSTGPYFADLCASSYDTKIYIYAGTCTGTPVACNDDAGCGYSGYQSRIENITLTAGTTYYIIVDGYGSSCGTYILTVDHFVPPHVECPATAYLEGEPPCVDNYFDIYNGGCNSPIGQQVWQPIGAQLNNCADMCGKSCTYLFGGFSYRDTDWYSCFGIGANLTLDVIAEFPVALIYIYGLNCDTPGYDYYTGSPMQHVVGTRYVALDVEIWPWVGPSVFSGVPESTYWLNLCGIKVLGVPVQPST